ncbi:MAG: Zn-dependent exopeptidase M28 [Planctomycetes bacterium]|nr:Zn-dependent exopeptidase M28 [Planctomycetota bacterium]
MSAFDASRARSFAALLARPRGCGSEEERWAARQVREAFRDAGLETEEEYFHFRPSGDLCVRVVLGFAVVSLGLVWAGVWVPWLAAAGFAGLGLLALAGPAMARGIPMARARAAKEIEVPPRGWLRASNVIGRAPGPAGSPLFVFVAHFDSKSQNMPITVRVGLFAALGICGLLGAELGLLHVWLGWPSPAVLHGLFAATFAIALPLLLLRTGNVSPGALDNACGVGTLVELARIWRHHPISWKARAVFISPSAEEHGLVGSRLWVARHLAQLRGEPRCRIINLDGCAATGELIVLPGTGVVAEALLAAARAASIPVRALPFGIGLLADHVPFVEAGLECASLLARGRGTSRIHTRGDSAELLDDRGFESAGKTVLGALERLLA